MQGTASGSKLSVEHNSTLPVEPRRARVSSPSQSALKTQRKPHSRPKTWSRSTWLQRKHPGTACSTHSPLFEGESPSLQGAARPPKRFKPHIDSSLYSMADTEKLVARYISSAGSMTEPEQQRRQRIGIMCDRMIEDPDFYKAMSAFAVSARRDIFGTS